MGYFWINIHPLKLPQPVDIPMQRLRNGYPGMPRIPLEKGDVVYRKAYGEFLRFHGGFSQAWKGTLIQYVGRLHRLHPGKREVRVIDYVDHQVPMLARMFEKRQAGYRSIGYEEDNGGTLL